MSKTKGTHFIKILLCSMILATSLSFSIGQKEANAMSVEDCTALKTGDEYGTTIRNAAVVAAVNNPSWDTFKKAAKGIVKAGVKANIIAVSYSLYNNYNACVKQLGNQNIQ